MLFRDLLVFHFLCIILGCVAETVEDSYVFIHYHKTGHDLSRKLGAAIQTSSCITRVFDMPRGDIVQQMKTLQSKSITYFRGPDALFDWSKFKSGAKIVHFVRDPTDLIISGYLYHSEVPPPGPEGWLHDPKQSMCKPNALNGEYIKTIENFAGAYINASLSTLVSNVYKLCLELKKKYDTKTIYASLKLADKNSTDIPHRMEGLRVEAVRTLQAEIAGDILRMVANAMYDAHAPQGMVRRAYMTEFPSGEKATFEDTVGGIIDFFDPSGKCIDKQAAVKHASTEAFIDTAPTTRGQDARGQHVTQGLMSPAMHAFYRQRLLLDPDIGPLLHVLSLALDVTQRKPDETAPAEATQPAPAAAGTRRKRRR